MFVFTKIVIEVKKQYKEVVAASRIIALWYKIKESRCKNHFTEYLQQRQQSLIRFTFCSLYVFSAPLADKKSSKSEKKATKKKKFKKSPIDRSASDSSNSSSAKKKKKKKLKKEPTEKDKKKEEKEVTVKSEKEHNKSDKSETSEKKQNGAEESGRKTMDAVQLRKLKHLQRQIMTLTAPEKVFAVGSLLVKHSVPFQNRDDRLLEFDLCSLSQEVVDSLIKLWPI